MNELEDKFRKAMINNAQLDNEKTSYSYQVDLYKDDLEELEENYNRVHKDYKDKSRVYIHSIQGYVLYYCNFIFVYSDIRSIK